MSSRLPDPIAGWEYRVQDIAGETPAQRESHRRGFQGELHLANQIQLNILHATGEARIVGSQQVVAWGHKVTEHGADIVSVDKDGNVFLWDSKYVGSGGSRPASETFTQPDRLKNAVEQAFAAICASTKLGKAKAQAIANIQQGKFTAITISFDGKDFHHPAVQAYRGREPIR
jgi:filamentous hemagglutinin